MSGLHGLFGDPQSPDRPEWIRCGPVWVWKGPDIGELDVRPEAHPEPWQYVSAIIRWADDVGRSCILLRDATGRRRAGVCRLRPPSRRFSVTLELRSARVHQLRAEGDYMDTVAVVAEWLVPRAEPGDR